MRCYVLERMVDVSGVSGTGIVAEAVESANGKVALFWTGAQSPAHSVAIYDSMADAIAVHCHNGASRFVLTPSSMDSADNL